MKKWYVSAKKADFNQIGAEFNIDPVIARIIRNRDVITSEEVREFLHGDINSLHDPALMYGIKEGVELLLSRIESAGRIRVIGDYDIDGISATFILLKNIQSFGGNVDYDIPDRILDGYGINKNLIDKAFRDGIDTIITCDNGISAYEEIKYAKSLGMTVIVTDHHEIPFSLDEMGNKQEIIPPADVVINPHQQKCNYPFKGLCGAVVAYKFVYYMYISTGRSLTPLLEMMDIAALATIGDVMDLRGENRTIVRLGLNQIKHTKNKGLQALIDVNNLGDKTIQAYHIGFVIGPCINAGGRLDTAKKALSLLMSENDTDAVNKAQELFELNGRRKQMTNDNVEIAIQLIENNNMNTDKVLVVYISDCHESLVGIVAGRLREKYYKPVFVLSDGDGLVKGSGRSIEEYNMFEEMNKCKDLFIKFGGHALAAGLSIEKDNIDELRRSLNENCNLTDEELTEKLKLDLAMPLYYVTEGLIEQLSLLEPFGKGNPKPAFAWKDVTVIEARAIGRESNVVKLKLLDDNNNVLDGILFNDTEGFKAFLTEKFGQDETNRLFSSRSNKVRINIAYYPTINEYNGWRSVQITLTDYC